eukprot:TRINITY_DN773107_c0_g1_i1.p1 TRINITY_DN773107_c0_g1~~TRINITY_DN773107_c0_g1_i1.p1  ORF type:complete len:315 (-),score=65.61 TRINITY_DN773107_c0_g1_i1:101-1045(-)
MSSGSSFVQQTICIIGGTGQIGTPLVLSLLSLGHKVLVITRSLTGKNAEKLKDFKERGAVLIELKDFSNVDEMAKVIEGADSLISCVPGAKEIIIEMEPLWLEAAVKAGCRRFVPTEFGCHTRSLDYGDGILFDYKKRLHEKIFESGIGWTFFYTGGIFDYFLPNLRFWRQIETFGNIDLPIYTHDINDIGRCAALCLTDDRTINKCVQMDYNCLTQREMLAHLKKSFSDYEFEYKHHSSEFITDARNSASDEITAKKGAETDRERWGINYVIYVLGKLHGFTSETIRASEIYPDFKCSRSPFEALADPAFVFE